MSHPLEKCTQDDVRKRYGIRRSRMTFWRWEKKGYFPKRMKLNSRVWYWVVEVEAWLIDPASWSLVRALEHKL